MKFNGRQRNDFVKQSIKSAHILPVGEKMGAESSGMDEELI